MARQNNPGIVRQSQRRQQSKIQREQSKQRALIVAGIIAVLFIVAIPAYGYWSNFIAPPRSVVLQVDDTKFTLGFITKYLMGLKALGAPVDLGVDPFRMMQQLQEDELVRSGAIGNGITVDASDVDQEVRDRIMGSSPDLANVPQDQIDREFNEAYLQFLDTSNLSEKEHWNFVEADLLKDKLRIVLGEDLPTVAKQAHLAWIVIPSMEDQGNDEAIRQAQESSQQVTLGLQAGADFAALADAYSADRPSAANGGIYGWVPEGAFGVLDETIFALEPGEASKAVRTQDSTYFFKVLEFAEEKDVEPDMMNLLKESALQRWFANEREFHRITSCFGSGSAGGACDWQYDWLVKQLREVELRESAFE